MTAPTTTEQRRRVTLESRLEHSKLSGNSFDLLRLIAAFSVLVSHSFVLTTGSELAEPIYRLTSGGLSLGFISVGVFFIISGFLIARSFERSSSLQSFVTKRALRIFPGLVVSLLVTVIAAAVLIGDLALLTRTGTIKFLGNALFLPVEQKVPGVFENLPLPHAFNGSLWTLKYEVACYGLVTVLLWFTPLRVVSIFLALAASFILGVLTDYTSLGGLIYHVAILADLFQYFGLGMLLNAFASRLPCSTKIAFGLLAIWGLTLLTPLCRTLTPLLLAYPVIVVGLMPSRLGRQLSRFGDLSYGTYVYAFPVQQAVIAVDADRTQSWLNIVLAGPLTLGLAYASWKVVERPMLRLKSASLLSKWRGRLHA